MDTRNKIFAVVGTVAILATAGITGLALFAQKDTTGTARTGATSSQTPTSGTSSSSTGSTAATSTSMGSMMSSGYKDGTYSSTISYNVPHGGQNSVKATVVISSGKISSVTTNDNYTDGQSSYYVSSFDSSVSSDAVGQPIGSYSPSQIGGASLTTYAFDQAISDIAAQAKG